MPTYIRLLKFTAKGAEQIKGGPGRLQDAKKRAKQQGGEIKAFYLTMGRYDAVAIVEAPNDEAAVAGSMNAAQLGFIRAETMRAFTEDEYKKLVSTLS
jgi:uncharacterized protein with GYD domain